MAKSCPAKISCMPMFFRRPACADQRADELSFGATCRLTEEPQVICQTPPCRARCSEEGGNYEECDLL